MQPLASQRLGQLPVGGQVEIGEHDLAAAATMATSAGCGSLTLMIMSARPKDLLGGATISAPLRGVVLVGQPEPSPAPASTSTRCPARVNSSTPTGNKANAILVTLDFFRHADDHGTTPILVFGKVKSAIVVGRRSQAKRPKSTFSFFRFFPSSWPRG